MKKVILSLFVIFFSVFSVYAEVEDNSIINELEKNKVEKLQFDFKLQKFESCGDLENVMEKYIKDYWKNSKRNNYPILYNKSVGIMEDSVSSGDSMETSSPSNESSMDMGGVGGGGEDFSKTNIQVDGVDESDIVKTDGKYIYYYNEADRFIYVVKSYTEKEIKVIKKIKLPDSFYSPVLYLGKNRLIIVSSGYSEGDYQGRGYFINRNSKTYTIVFDTTDVTKPNLIKLYASDGDLTNTRKIGKYLYVLSTNYFNIPYYNFKEESDIDIKINKIIPKGIELSKTSIKSKQNFKIKGKTAPYNIKVGNVANCNEIEYILPDSETLKKFDFSPAYNIISVIDTENVDIDVKTKIIAGSNAEVYMSLDNLYLTTNLYQTNNFSCPRDAMCIMPWFPMGNNTLVHKINIDKNNLSYQDSTIIPGQPLTQYSMDENAGDFRIITKKWDPRETGLYILDEDLKLKGELTGLGKTEDFKSSRFIGDKLFLVTFKQIDPLFAIDLSDSTKPKILGELKIPGYSTYLHPYDDNHLIGLGYDTKENQWGGTVNSGVKVDLYEINYDKKCGDSNLTEDEKNGCDTGDYKGIIVKQKYSTTLGETSSYSEALDNPRMFMWNKGKNNLLLPVTLYKNDKTNIYRNIDFFNGLVSLNIDKNNGIKENYRLTHIDTSNLEAERIKDCANYKVPKEELECKILLDGTKYCPSSNVTYVPTYCYSDSLIGEYLATKSFDYLNDFVKRALWIGSDAYTISNKKIVVSELDSGEKKGSVEMFK